MPAPANDNFANAITITGTSGSTSPVTIDLATTEVSEPSGSNLFSPGIVQQSIWYVWTCPSSGIYAFDTFGSSTNASDDTTLAIWTGSSLAALVEVASNDDVRYVGGFWSRVAFTATASTVYRIQVGTFDSGTTGTLLLNWEPAPASLLTPPNDDLDPNAQLLSGSAEVEGTTGFATADTGYYDVVCDPVDGGGGGNSVWYKIAVPGDWSATLSTLGVRVKVIFEGVNTYTPLVQVCGFTTFPPASSADVLFLASGYPTVPAGGGNLFTYTGAAPASGWFYVGIGSQNSFESTRFTISYQFSKVGSPMGVSVAFDAPPFSSTPFWTRLDA